MRRRFNQKRTIFEAHSLFLPLGSTRFNDLIMLKVDAVLAG